uniref:Uncharacterized protein n=1 Tax=Anguilla anguilla TaxID=7936 RepID=A0A0E9TP81_ANGAN
MRNFTMQLVKADGNCKRGPFT